MYINSTSLLGKIDLYWRQLIKLRNVDLLNMINPHRWIKHFPNHSRMSQTRKSMSELSRVIENMLILYNGKKIMEDGLETKDTSFLVN